MVKATITWKTGGAENIYCNSFPELFQRLQEYGRYTKLFAREIEPQEMRQGRCRSEGSTEGRYCQQL